MLVRRPSDEVEISPIWRGGFTTGGRAPPSSAVRFRGTWAGQSERLTREKKEEMTPRLYTDVLARHIGSVAVGVHTGAGTGRKRPLVVHAFQPRT